VAVFHKLCKIAQSSRVHKTESVSAIGHARSVAVSSIGSCQKQRKLLSTYCVGKCWKEYGTVTMSRCNKVFSSDRETTKCFFLLLESSNVIDKLTG